MRLNTPAVGRPLLIDFENGIRMLETEETITIDNLDERGIKFYYFASDIDSSQITKIIEFYTIAKQAWGGYGPLEFWIIGTNISAAMQLDEYYCDLRMQEDHCLDNGYLQWCLNREYSFEDYAIFGGAGLSLNRENPEEFCSGYSYMEITLSSQFPFPNETDYNVVTMHEYFHAYQHSHIYTFDYDERSELMVENPWWSEGGAEYMAQLLYSQQTGVSVNYLRERMTWKMNSKNDLLEGELISTQTKYASNHSAVFFESFEWIYSHIFCFGKN